MIIWIQQATAKTAKPPQTIETCQASGQKTAAMMRQTKAMKASIRMKNTGLLPIPITLRLPAALAQIMILIGDHHAFARLAVDQNRPAALVADSLHPFFLFLARH